MSHRIESMVDVLIVGAGSAGAVLAARLSEDPNRSVLLLDEGPDHGDRTPPSVLDPSTIPSMTRDRRWTRWYDVTLRQGREVKVPRGRLFGGSSAVNGAHFLRGTREDFDHWAELGNPEWSFEQVLPSFRRSERDLDHPQSPWHGAEGPMPVCRPDSDALHPVTRAFCEAARAAGFPAEADKNAPGPPGVGLVPHNVVDGVRVNTAAAYLEPNRDRSNLQLRPGIRVRRVVIEAGRVVGVEVDAGRAAQIIRAHEVVLSAGAVASAELLLRSGVGPAADLLALGVEVVVDAPGVGRLWDHPALDVFWIPEELAASVQDRQHHGRAAPAAEALLHFDSGVGERGDDLELSAMTSSYGAANGEAPADPTLSLRVGLQRTKLPGRVTLAGVAPHSPPLIRHRYLEAEADRARARRAVRTALELLASRPFADLGARVLGPTSVELSSDAALDRWIEANVVTSMHSSGTCAMGPDGDELAVVDQRCRVRGVDGLRVVDTSIMPALTSRGPAATAVMIGERAAQLFD